MKCLNSHKQMALGLAVYASDYDGRFTSDSQAENAELLFPNVWFKMLMPYLGNNSAI